MKYLKLYQNYLKESVDNNIIKDIYSRVNSNEFNKWINENSSNNIEDMNEEDILWEFELFLKSEKALEINEGVIEFYKLWEDVESLIGNNPIKLYHFTSSKYEESIKENGLGVGYNKTNPFSNSYSGVYLTTETSGNVIDGYKHHIRKVGGDVILIEIKSFLSEIDNDPDDNDIESGETQFVMDFVPVDRILNIEKVY